VDSIRERQPVAQLQEHRKPCLEQARAREDDLRPARLSDTGPILDERAKTAYRERLRELEEELAEATSWADPVRAARARQEMQFLADQLAAAVGLGGRDRTTGSAAERAQVGEPRAFRTADLQ
jgi:cytochrome c-type biogenesis protein CcmH/NrfG